MKKLFGFTLAEILITLSIVGVIAALTVPTLATESRKKVYAKSLAVAVSDFETAMKNMIERENVDTLKETPAWVNCGRTIDDRSKAEVNKFISDLSIYLPVSSSSIVGRNYRMLNSQNTVNVGRMIKLKTKKGVEYAITLVRANDNDIKTDNDVLSNGVTYKEQVATVNIDVNGADQPNMIGRDLFFYELGNDGILYPRGSKDYNFYHGSGAAADNFANGCTGDTNSNCSEYLRQNGYKMDY